MKNNARYGVIQPNPVQDNTLEDQLIRLTSSKGKLCAIALRRTRFVRQKDQKKSCSSLMT